MRVSTELSGFVLAAGLGTRLRPLSLELPKPAWPFFDHPLAAHALNLLFEVGVRRVVVNMHHLPERMRGSLADYIPGGMEVRWAHEETILGTGGALVPHRDLLGRGPFILVNGDTYRNFSLAEMISRHREEGNIATLALEETDSNDGLIGVDREGRIVSFLGRRAPDSAGVARWCSFAGVHLFEPEVLGELRGGEFCINKTVNATLVEKGAKVGGWFPGKDGWWTDLGTPKRYLDGHFKSLAANQPPKVARGVLHGYGSPEFTTSDGGCIRPPAFIGAGAHVMEGGVAGPYAVVGRGATVGSGGEVVRSVLWPGASLDSKAENRIISQNGESMGAEVA